MTMLLPPELPFKVFTWYRHTNGKEFIIVDFDVDFDQPDLPVTGLKVVEKYQNAVKVFPLEVMKRLLATQKIKEITLIK